MSKFFDSEMVRESLMELEKLQEEIFGQMFHLPLLTILEKIQRMFLFQHIMLVLLQILVLC